MRPPPFFLTHFWCSATINRRRALHFAAPQGAQAPCGELQSGGAMYRAMHRSAVACIVMLPWIAAFATQKPVPKTPASVKLWVDSSSSNACEQASPASGTWMIRNDEGRDVLVTVHRMTTKDGVTKEDQIRDTLGPRESRELGCEISEDGRQTLTIVNAKF
jgi:hypothetical protein